MTTTPESTPAKTREEPKATPDPAEVPNPAVQAPDLVSADDPY
jgi:hypothetical protein